MKEPIIRWALRTFALGRKWRNLPKVLLCCVVILPAAYPEVVHQTLLLSVCLPHSVAFTSTKQPSPSHWWLWRMQRQWTTHRYQDTPSYVYRLFPAILITWLQSHWFQSPPFPFTLWFFAKNHVLNYKKQICKNYIRNLNCSKSPTGVINTRATFSSFCYRGGNYKSPLNTKGSTLTNK